MLDNFSCFFLYKIFPGFLFANQLKKILQHLQLHEIFIYISKRHIYRWISSWKIRATTVTWKPEKIWKDPFHFFPLYLPSSLIWGVFSPSSSLKRDILNINTHSSPMSISRSPLLISFTAITVYFSTNIT